ncbi:hypothetical protein [Cohnella sp.]|uniref:hypothetical protein n=1 Tax=Cohnella sp. TaxID=1883426 RepID=UPI003703C3DC
MALEKVLDDIEREGELRGRIEGKLEGKEQVTMRMIEEQLDADLISRVTGFSLDKIDQLRARGNVETE